MDLIYYKNRMESLQSEASLFKTVAENLEMDLIFYKHRYEVVQGEVNHYKNMQVQQDLITGLFQKGEVK